MFVDVGLVILCCECLCVYWLVVGYDEIVCCFVLCVVIIFFMDCD